jgi:ABC-type maltose transport system permease subunit
MIGISFDKALKRLASDTVFIFIGVALIIYPVYSMIHSSFNPTKRGEFSHVKPPDKTDWKVREIVEYIYSEVGRMPLGNGNLSNYVIMAIEHPAINNNTYDYISSTTWQYLSSPVHFTSLGYAESDINKAVNRVRSFNPSFLVFAENIPGIELAGFLNSLNDELKLMVDSGQLAYVKDKTFELQNGVRILLYKRISIRD